MYAIRGSQPPQYTLVSQNLSALFDLLDQKDQMAELQQNH